MHLVSAFVLSLALSSEAITDVHKALGVDAKSLVAHSGKDAEERLRNTLSFDEAFVSVEARAKAARHRSPDELRELRASSVENVARADLDGDRRLSLAEFQQLLKIMSSKHEF
mmetsp:Transcript_724/g.1319  ORF Transcript_724/g.1319 Transcript_724/m.1319 type:complete len:113 (+) Transcript_724:87-425(+)